MKEIKIKEIEGYFDKIGTLETYVGYNVIDKANLILPIYNAMLDEHPLNKSNNTYYIDYCFFVFKNLISFRRDVFDNNATFLYNDQYDNNLNTYHQKSTDFLVELLDFNNAFQYWNWVIKAEMFSILVIESKYKLQSEISKIEGDYAPNKTELSGGFSLNQVKIILDDENA